MRKKDENKMIKNNNLPIPKTAKIQTVHRKIGKNVVISDNVVIVSKDLIIDDNVIIGANTTIKGNFVKIGMNSEIKKKFRHKCYRKNLS